MAGELAQLQTTAVVMVPVSATAVPDNAIYSDSDQLGAFSNKSPTGTVVQVVSTSTELLVKKKQNLSGAAIPAGMPISLKADGSIIQADSDHPDIIRDIGVAAETIADGAEGSVVLIGPNIQGAVSGLGFSPGDPVFLSEDKTYTNTLASFTGGNDRIVRMGFADCPAGAASSTATDLVISYEIVSDIP